MGLKLIHSADWHLGAAFSGFSPRMREYLKDCHKTLPRRVGELIAREGVQLVLLAGDIFDSPHPKKMWVELLKGEFARWDVPVCITPGNHDYCCPGSPWLEEVWPENVHIFTGSLESIAFPELGCRIYGAGYRSMDCPPLLEGFRIAGEERHQIALLHTDPGRPDTPYCPVTQQQIRDSGLDYVLMGHIHRYGYDRLRGREKDIHCLMSGCPMGRSWEESAQEGVVLMEEAYGTLVPRRETLGLPRLYDWNTTLPEDPESAIRAMLSPDGGKDLHRFTFRGEGAVDIQTLLEKFPHEYLELVDRTVPPLDLWARAEEDSLLGEYFRHLRQQAGEEPLAAQAAEISQRILQGREVDLP